MALDHTTMLDFADSEELTDDQVRDYVRRYGWTSCYGHELAYAPTFAQIACHRDPELRAVWIEYETTPFGAVNPMSLVGSPEYDAAHARYKAALARWLDQTGTGS